MFYFGKMEFDLNKCKVIWKELSKGRECRLCKGVTYVKDMCKECTRLWNKKKNAFDGIEYD